ncbi:MAG: hypothetical protein JSW54_00810 [Fidelibacterota bacterium]|nr:MAG: hypothetical protein JSW54_00810 [Candidatus Neomarinimicrobiota bacterium]
MLKNYLTVAIRNLLRKKTHPFINITGPVLGLSDCFLYFFRITRMEHWYD